MAPSLLPGDRVPLKFKVPIEGPPRDDFAEAAGLQRDGSAYGQPMSWRALGSGVERFAGDQLRGLSLDAQNLVTGLSRGSLSLEDETGSIALGMNGSIQLTPKVGKWNLSVSPGFTGDRVGAENAGPGRVMLGYDSRQNEPRGGGGTPLWIEGLDRPEATVESGRSPARQLLDAQMEDFYGRNPGFSAYPRSY